MKITQLHDYHKKKAKLAEFAGYEMPLWYSSTLEEHMAVRNYAGAFDVSHMGRIVVSGRHSTDLLERLVPTNVATQPVGKSFYTLFLNEEGGIIDDLIIMKLSDSHYLLVVNAANSAIDLNHILHGSEGLEVDVNDITSDTAMIAVQGPSSRTVLQPLVGINLAELKRFRCTETTITGHPCIISRTGYTGEDGFEVIIHGVNTRDPSKALHVWDEITKAAKPCGLAARDTLRLEAGYPLHGADIDTNTNPFEAELSWVISPEKQGYIGYRAIATAREVQPRRLRRGLILEEMIPRHGFEVVLPNGKKVGEVTSGSFSPVIKKGISLAYLDVFHAEPGESVLVRVRGVDAPAHVVRPPFYDEKVYGWKRQDNSK
jgi:aminomethyltransferase